MNEIYSNPLWGIALTCGCYAAALAIHRRLAWCHPLVMTVALLAGLLLAGRVPLETVAARLAKKGSMNGGDYLVFLLGPATVALAVPLHKNRRQIRRHLVPLLVAVFAGAVTAIATGGLMVWALHGSGDVLRVMLPKSVTTPIAVEIVAQLEGSPRLGSLEATLVVFTGLFGALIGPAYLRWLHIRRDLPLGLAIGTAAHGIGTASLVHRSELQASAAGLAMGLNGIMTSVLMIPLYAWFR